MNQLLQVFDRTALRRHRDRAAGRSADHEFLFHNVAARLADRLLDVRRTFPRALELGCRRGLMSGHLADSGRVETLVQADVSPAMARAAAATGRPTVCADEEALPFAEASFDLVICPLSLHWVNDLPGTLLQINRMLRPDGLLLAALLGGETLQELRDALMQAELLEEGGVSPRVSPALDVRDAGGLLQRAGFALPVADTDTLTVTYGNVMRLLRDLQAMGESNAVAGRRRAFSRRATLLRAAAHYRDNRADAAGRVPATFQVIYLTGWRPDASQQKPLRPGTAAHRLAEALDSAEISTPAPTAPKKND